VATPPPARAAELRARLAELRPARVHLLVSVAAGQVLPLLPPSLGSVVTWVVEVGDDLHWVDDPTGLIERTTDWWAGSAASEADLRQRPALAAVRAVRAPEFVADPPVLASEEVAARRRELGAGPDDLLVVGAGIGTWRKGLDLFAEAAALLGQRGAGTVRCHWVGGSDDPLWPKVEADRHRAGLSHLTLEPAIADLAPTFAAADVVLHPARLDAFPLVCVQAAALGTPVVGFSGVGGLPDMLGPGFRGAAYPDVEALVDEVVALRNPAARHALGTEQAAAVAPFLASRAGRQVADLLEAAGAGRGR
jgi:glycosyltransferase involved in cell wall biosynthesis